MEAFSKVVNTIKREIVKSRQHWDAHEPRMWSRAAQLSDNELTNFSLSEDLVLVSSAATTYGTIILGKIRIPAINDNQGKGFVHVRYVIYDTYTTHTVRNGDLTSARDLGSTTRLTEYCRFYQSLSIVLLT